VTIDVKDKFVTRIYLGLRIRPNVSATVQTAALGQVPRSAERILVYTYTSGQLSLPSI